MNLWELLRMLNTRLIFFLSLIAALAACGKDSEPDSEQAAEGGAHQDGTSSESPDPPAFDAAVLITDITLGGRCVFDEPADTAPGASLASVQIIGTDGESKGYGRRLWDAPGFAIAAERGTPPDGAAPVGTTCDDFYNLGCDGQAVFEIIGESGEVQKLRAGDTVVVHLRGQESCGEVAADEIESAICNDPAAAASGNLSSCTYKVRMVGMRSDLYGPDRVGGTIQHLAGK